MSKYVRGATTPAIPNVLKAIWGVSPAAKMQSRVFIVKATSSLTTYQKITSYTTHTAVIT